MQLLNGVEQTSDKRYVLATLNPLGAVFTTFYDCLQHRKGWKTCTMSCGHDIMIDLPKDLTDFILS